VPQPHAASAPQQKARNSSSNTRQRQQHSRAPVEVRTCSSKQLLPTPVSPMMMYLNKYAYDISARQAEHASRSSAAAPALDAAHRRCSKAASCKSCSHARCRRLLLSVLLPHVYSRRRYRKAQRVGLASADSHHHSKLAAFCTMCVVNGETRVRPAVRASFVSPPA